ncbi:MAG TPA: hypothetical protein VJ872_18855 [Nocardioides sp.]|nr:hypothetical protein [Nocardioides sp.]
MSEYSDNPTEEPAEVIETTEPSQATGPTQTAPFPQDTPWHPVHIPHLVMGLAFLGLVVVWALVVPLNAVELPHARWLLPLPWLVAGAAGLVATVLSGRRRRLSGTGR